MALLRRLLYRKPPDGLLEITERIYVDHGEPSIQDEPLQSSSTGIPLCCSHRQPQEQTHSTPAFKRDNIALEYQYPPSFQPIIEQQSEPRRSQQLAAEP